MPEKHQLMILGALPLLALGLLSTSYVSSTTTFNTAYQATGSLVGFSATVQPTPGSFTDLFPVPAFTFDVPTMIGVVEMFISFIWLAWLWRHW